MERSQQKQETARAATPKRKGPKRGKAVVVRLKGKRFFAEVESKSNKEKKPKENKADTRVRAQHEHRGIFLLCQKRPR